MRAYTLIGKRLPKGDTRRNEDHGLETARVSRSAFAEIVQIQKATEKINEKRKDEEIMRYRIRLETMAEVNKFVGIATKVKGSLTLTDGDNFTVNGKSLLGAMYTFEWDRIFCESENEIYHLIKDFIVEESDPIVEE